MTSSRKNEYLKRYLNDMPSSIPSDYDDKKKTKKRKKKDLDVDAMPLAKDVQGIAFLEDLSLKTMESVDEYSEAEDEKPQVEMGVYLAPLISNYDEYTEIPRIQLDRGLKQREDLSPPRRSKVVQYDCDLSPPRRPKESQYDSDLSPPRRSKPTQHNLDLSPPRSSTSSQYDHNLSPPRSSRELSTHRHTHHHRSVSSHASYKSYESRNTNQAHLDRLLIRNQSIEDISSEHVLIDHHHHTPSFDSFSNLKDKDQSKDALKLVGRDGEKKAMDLDHLHRSERDQQLRSNPIWDDPLLKLKHLGILDDDQKEKTEKYFIAKDQLAALNDPIQSKLLEGVKKFKGWYPPNRFDIPPSSKWDGIDRSNGFEAKHFQKQNEAKIEQEMKYKYAIYE